VSTVKQAIALLTAMSVDIISLSPGVWIPWRGRQNETPLGEGCVGKTAFSTLCSSLG